MPEMARLNRLVKVHYHRTKYLRTRLHGCAGSNHGHLFAVRRDMETFRLANVFGNPLRVALGEMFLIFVAILRLANTEGDVVSIFHGLSFSQVLAN